MKPDPWLLLAASALVLAAMASIGSMFRSDRRWSALVLGARGVALAAVVMGLVASVEVVQPLVEPRQAGLALALATLLVQLGLGFLLGTIGAGPIVDLIVLVLVLLPLFMGPTAGRSLDCAHLLLPYWAAWAFLTLGTGSAVVAGSSGVLLIIRNFEPVASRIWRLDSPSFRALMVQAILITVASLGIGLTAGVWWAWRTTGVLGQGDPRLGGVALVWLFAAMSQLAWQVRGDGERWAAGLAVLAAAAALFESAILR